MMDILRIVISRRRQRRSSSAVVFVCFMVVAADLIQLNSAISAAEDADVAKQRSHTKDVDVDEQQLIATAEGNLAYVSW